MLIIIRWFISFVNIFHAYTKSRGNSQLNRRLKSDSYRPTVLPYAIWLAFALVYEFIFIKMFLRLPIRILMHTTQHIQGFYICFLCPRSALHSPTPCIHIRVYVMYYKSINGSSTSPLKYFTVCNARFFFQRRAIQETKKKNRKEKRQYAWTLSYSFSYYK